MPPINRTIRIWSLILIEKLFNQKSIKLISECRCFMLFRLPLCCATRLLRSATHSSRLVVMLFDLHAAIAQNAAFAGRIQSADTVVCSPFGINGKRHPNFRRNIMFSNSENYSATLRRDSHIEKRLVILKSSSCDWHPLQWLQNEIHWTSLTLYSACTTEFCPTLKNGIALSPLRDSLFCSASMSRSIVKSRTEFG